MAIMKWLLVVLALFAQAAAAQDWPHRPVKIIVPFAAASTPDTFARILADSLRRRLGQPFIVENKPGASGMIGTDAVAKAPPDGYTIGVSIVGPLVTNKLLYKSMAYDPDRDLAPITIALVQPSILVVPADRNIRTVAELLAELRKRPGKANYASIGVGSLSHLTMELIAAKSGTQIVHVPYAGSSQAVTALVAGDVDVACLPGISVLPQVTAGKLRALAVTTAKRSPALPDVPTLKEQGVDIEAGAWNGLIAPAGTPAPLLDRIRHEVVTTLKEPEVVGALRNQMMEVVGSTPEEFAAYLKEERERWTPVIVKNHITLD
jgi:tripartite-type tricarboxylate transporter receptor subunit TctC